MLAGAVFLPLVGRKSLTCEFSYQQLPTYSIHNARREKYLNKGWHARCSKRDYMATSTYAAAGVPPWSVAQPGRNLGLPLCLPCRVGKSPSERNVDAAMGICARMGRGRPSYSVDMDEGLLPKEDRKWDRFRTPNKIGSSTRKK